MRTKYTYTISGIPALIVLAAVVIVLSAGTFTLIEAGIHFLRH